LSKEAREFHQRAKTAWLLERFATGVRTLGDVPVKVRIVVHPPDRRRRDLDNVLKAILDSLEKSDVIEDDRQVRRLLVEFGQTVKGGKVVVEIERLPGVEKQRPAIVS
jgi:crossover junction endodeoxyribonuclease RusA